MRSETDVVAKLEEATKRLDDTRAKWRVAVMKEADGTLPHARNIDEDPQCLSALIGYYESGIYTLQWVLEQQKEM